MEFITLQDVLNGIAARITPRPHHKEETKFQNDIFSVQTTEFWNNSIPQIGDEQRFSDAARSLHKALHHATVFPKWYKYDKEKEFEVSSDAAAIEGGKLLTKATGLSAKLMENRSKHIRFCEVNMWNPATATVGFNMDDMWPPRTAFLSNIEIGFDRAELVNFLNENNVAHSLGRRAAPAIEPMTPAAVVTLPPAEAPILHQKEAEQSTKHRIGNRTASILDAEIGEAKKLAINPDDKSSVWTELVKMAEKKIGCLLGMDGKDIKYQSGDGVLFFKKRSLNERMNRAFKKRSLNERMNRAATH